MTLKGELLSFGHNIVQHFQRRNARAFLVGFPLLSFIGPLTPLIRAQNERLRPPPCGCGALRLEPVARLYLRLPLAVRPPFLLFSPRPMDSETPFLLAILLLKAPFHLTVGFGRYG